MEHPTREPDPGLVEAFVMRLKLLNKTMRPLNPAWLNDELPPLRDLLEEIETESPPMPIIS